MNRNPCHYFESSVRNPTLQISSSVKTQKILAEISTYNWDRYLIKLLFCKIQEKIFKELLR